MHATKKMGKASRWLKGLFGMKKQRDQGESDRRDKNKGNFSQSSGGNSDPLCQNPSTIPPNITPAEAAWLRSFYSESENEQSKHAIAVAAATAAAADAAVAAAQAAVAVVRLTSQGRGTVFGSSSSSRDQWAAVKIQSTFRGFLARKALRALKGIVKVQALVRGYLVRKEAAATFHSMQALITAQATVRAKKNRGFIKSEDDFQPPFGSRKSAERLDDTRSEQTIMSSHSRRLSASFETPINGIDHGSPKIVEVDTGRPSSRSRRSNTWMSDSGDESFGCGQILPSPLPQRIPARLSIPDSRGFYDSEWGLTGEEYRFSTAQSTPRFANSSCCNPAPSTPAKSVCAAESVFRRYGQCPNYMASTQSFKAKLRSQSAPKQRPEAGQKKTISLNEMLESRSSLSGVGMEKSCARAQGVINFKNAVMGKLERFSDFSRDHHKYRDRDRRDYYYMEAK